MHTINPYFTTLSRYVMTQRCVNVVYDTTIPQLRCNVVVILCVSWECLYPVGVSSILYLYFLYVASDTAPQYQILKQNRTADPEYIAFQFFGIDKVSSEIQFGCLSSHLQICIM